MGDVPGIPHMAHRALGITYPDHLLDAPIAVAVLQWLDDHRRVHQAREYCVGADALAGILQRHRAGERHDCALGRRIGYVRHTGPAAARDAADIDDGAAQAMLVGSLALHHRQDVLVGQELAAQIDRHDPLPAFLARLDRPAEL